MHAVITGATGFVGKNLISKIKHPVVLSRNLGTAKAEFSHISPIRIFPWNPSAGTAPLAAFEDADVVFHLAGESVAGGRWNAERKRRIRDSRVEGTRYLVETLARLERRPRVLVAASAVGFYGSRGDEILRETSGPGKDFLADVCVAWEKAALQAETLGIRVVLVRISLVLGRGGVLTKMLLPFRLGLGGIIGSGKQWMPWIHVDDLVALLLRAAQEETLRGPINAVAPQAITNKQFTQALGKALHRPTLFPVPHGALRLVLGEFANYVAGSQHVESEKLGDMNFKFQYPTIDEAVATIVS